MKCCGDRPYDPSRNIHTCCHASLSLNSHGKNVCCGKVPYSPSNDTCCRGRIHKAKKQSCCGKNTYDSSKEICCGRIIYSVEKYGSKCCKKVAYNQTTQGCRHGKVVGKMLCGRRHYDDVTHVCCGQRLYVRSRDFKCCYQLHYNTLTSICCGRKVYPKTRVCCNKRVYSGKVRCCGEVVYNKKSSFQCCNGKTYNKKKFRCKKGRILSKNRMKRKLCNEHNNIGKLINTVLHLITTTTVMKTFGISIFVILNNHHHYEHYRCYIFFISKTNLIVNYTSMLKAYV